MIYDDGLVYFHGEERLKAVDRKLISMTVPSGICPGCNKKVYSAHNWVFTNKQPLCKVCTLDLKEFSVYNLVHSVYGKVWLNEGAVRAFRVKCMPPYKGEEWTVKKLAQRMGWSAAYQSKLEIGKVSSIHTLVLKQFVDANAYMSTLTKTETELMLVDTMRLRCNINPDILSALRIKYNMASWELAELMDCSKAQLSVLERFGRSTIELDIIARAIRYFYKLDKELVSIPSLSGKLDRKPILITNLI